MADGVQITAGAGTSVATDGIDDPGTPGVAGTTQHHQRVKIETGPDGAATDVSEFEPMPTNDEEAICLLRYILIELRVLNTLIQDQSYPSFDLNQLRDDYNSDVAEGVS